jgi:hypothetical protein
MSLAHKKHILLRVVAGFALFVFCFCFGAPSFFRTRAAGQQPAQSARRDGQHDFDFDLGTWKVHMKRLQHPLTGSTNWTELNGTVSVRKIWDGKANLAEIEADGADGHLEFLSLRLYNPDSHQWSLLFANPKTGSFGVPLTGEFKDGRGEFIDQEPIDGRVILVRFTFSNITPNSGHSEQAFSDDMGKTWEVNWINDYTRISNEPTEVAASSTEKPSEPTGKDGQHDFDFNLGTWKTHMQRLQHPLSGSANWVELNGTVTIKKLWNGKAQLEEVEADGPSGHFEDLAVFLYDPTARQWNMNFANSKYGMLGVPPTVGEFKNGRGEFYDQEPFHGRMILVRILWTDITPNSHRFEQAFSDDGGKTWEPNFVATLTREKE